MHNNECEGAQMTSKKSRKGKKSTAEHLEDYDLQLAEEPTASSPMLGRESSASPGSKYVSISGVIFSPTNRISAQINHNQIPACYCKGRGP